jgi:cob(I)alamin adenosyltransferase
VVTLNRIYTKAGDGGRTRLASGEEVAKTDLRVEAYGTTDEANAIVGLARIALAGSGDDWLDAALGRIQNDLFDLGADLATPDRGKPLEWTPLRIVPAQVTRLETELDAMNDAIAPLDSFVLPGGTPAAAHLHHARTVVRRAERVMAALMQVEGEVVSEAAFHYINRLSDFLFVAARRANANGAADVKWVPGANRG